MRNGPAISIYIYIYNLFSSLDLCVSHTVLSSTDDFVHPLLFACESRNPRLVQLALSALQKPIQYNAIPQVLAQFAVRSHCVDRPRLGLI